MRKQPIFILLCSFILGILLQEYFIFSLNTIFTFVIISFLLQFFHQSKNIKIAKLRTLFLISIFLTSGILFHFFNSQPPHLPIISKETELTFTLSKKLKSTEKNNKYEGFFFLKGKKYKSLFYIAKNENLDFIHLYKGKLKFLNIQKPNDYQFNYKKYLERKGVYFQIYIPHQTLSQSFYKKNIFQLLKILKERISKNIDESSLSIQTKNFLKSIVIADKTEFENDLLKDFQKSGLIHLLTISGTHIGIIFYFFFFGFKRIIPLRFKKVSIILSLLFIWLFAIFIGLENSVTRACIMLSTYFLSILLERKPNTLHSLSLAGFIVLLFNTQELFDIGFQLSFIAVLGIYWLSKPISHLFPKKKNKIYKTLVSIFSISLSAQLGILPFTLFYFHQISLISLVSNLIIIPFAEIIIVFSFVMMILLANDLSFNLINELYNAFISFFLKLVHFLGNIKYSFIENIPANIIECIIIGIIIYQLHFFITNQNFRRNLNVFLFIFLFIIARISFNFYYREKEEIIIHHFYPCNVLSIKQQNKVYFWINKNNSVEKVKNYIISPYLLHIRTNDYKIYFIDKQINQIIFKNKIYRINHDQ